jgi:hypothetical protein
METAKKMSATQNKALYLLFTCSGLILIFLADDISWAGILLATGVVFSPFDNKPFSALSLLQKGIVISQILVAAVLIGIKIFYID